MAGDKYIFETETKWTEGKRMKLIVKGQPELEVSPPTEFGGPEGFLTPQDLFVASASTCYTTTFFTMAAKARLNYVDFTCRAEGTLEKLGEKGFKFTRVDLYPEVTVAEEGERERARQVLETSKKYCLVTNSMTSTITLNPTIKVK
jgi:organic hydroperoxide reductase OsmC/OhrA